MCGMFGGGSGFVSAVGFEDAAWGFADEEDYLVALGGGRHLFHYFLEYLCGVVAGVEDEAVDVLYVVDLLVCEAAAAESDGVDAAVGDWLAGCGDVWRDVFVDF